MTIYFVSASSLTITDDASVPTPTKRFGTIFNFTKSSFLRLCDVDTETVDFIDSTLEVT